MHTFRPFFVVTLLAATIGCTPTSTPIKGTETAAASSVTTQRVCDITAELLGVNASDVKPTTSLADLAADELDAIELVMELEEEFEIAIPDNAITVVTGDNSWQAGFDKLTMEKLAQIVDAQER